MIGQLDHIAIIDRDVPDFGAVSGTWGPVQFYRPFGVKGILLEEWSDLLTMHPISGEPFNTDRQGWMSLKRNASLWSQLHPDLTAEADTTAASLLVNYKQGDGDFKDFTVWYHNSLGKSTRYGWNSKLRSHQRFLGVTLYDEQGHRLQIENGTDDYVLRVEAGYDHQVNPLYMYELDTATQVWAYNDDLQIRSDRWDGNVRWHNFDSSSTGSEVFVSVQGGIWDWPVGQRQSLSTMAYFGHRFKVGDLSPAELKFGALSNQIGGAQSARHFIELKLPGFNWKDFTAELGLKNLGVWHWLPTANIQFMRGPFDMSYQTRHLLEDRTWEPQFNASTIHHLQARLALSGIDLSLGHWQGKKDASSVSGYHGNVQFEFPWMMQISIGGSKVDQRVDWVWAEKQLNWELNQDVILFDEALFGHLKVWGRHLFEPQLGLLDPETIQVQVVPPSGTDEVLHLLNYTIYAQVSTLIIGFSDSNMLQDPLWSQYASVPWDSEFTIMVNQFPETRFRYLSLIWVFDN